jgi:hypothetical protein
VVGRESEGLHRRESATGTICGRTGGTKIQVEESSLTASLERGDDTNPLDLPNYVHLLQSDWTFADSFTRGATHGIHPYPAKFIPQIPRSLIAALYPNDGTAVLDPFCGSGTTLVEAAIRGVPSIGVDLHPLACLISKVKVTPLTRSLSAAANELLGQLRDEALPVIPGLDHWFAHDIQRALSSIRCGIDRESDSDVRDALSVAFSSIVVRVSRQESDTRYAAVDNAFTPADVRRCFHQAAQSIDAALASTWDGLFRPGPVRVIHKDVLTVTPADIGTPVSLVVTSPPYPNAYEYWLYHKYRMYWLGMDPIAVREREIGARPHYFKTKPHTCADFERQMRQVFALLSAVVVSGGHACFQIGRSIIHGETIDNSAILRRAAEAHGFEEVARMTRTIPRTRKAFNPSHSRIANEHILVFRRTAE